MAETARKITIHIKPSAKELREAAERAKERAEKRARAHAKAKVHMTEHEKEKLLRAAKLLRRRELNEKKEHVIAIHRAKEEKIEVKEDEPFIPLEMLMPEKAPAVPAHPVPEVAPQVALPEATLPQAEAMVPARMPIPKKPTLVEGIPMNELSVAYFSMEIGIESGMPTYAGGLGILAADMLLSCADLDIPAVGVTLVYRKGYFKQHLDESGWQFEEASPWNPYGRLALLPHRAKVRIEGRDVIVRAWLYKVTGVRGRVNPILFLDTDFTDNAPEDRSITDRLYGSDLRERLKQEVVLGIGGLRMLEAIGATNIQKFHMNEGHAALIALELYRQYASCDDPMEEVRARSVFTTHTPIGAGHDRFDSELVRSVLGADYIPQAIRETILRDGGLNMTHVGLDFSRFVNGVAKRHGEVSRELFPGYRIESITNGVHAGRWVSEPMAALYDKYLPGWRLDNFSLRYALSIPTDELWRAHEENKWRLISVLNERYAANFDPNFFTIGFARRATAYKRSELLFSDIERLMRLADKTKGIQIVFAGKAHPADRDGKLMIQRVIGHMRNIGHKIRCVYVPDYDIAMSKLLIAGSDLWLNTPKRPQEASGTSGMKAALNGVPQLSSQDGWWLEGHIENVTGWSLGKHPSEGESSDWDDANDMYAKLENFIIPQFENEREQWANIMRSSIAINGSFFNTHRMAEQYVLGAYFK